jgi:O-antigen ligase
MSVLLRIARSGAIGIVLCLLLFGNNIAKLTGGAGSMVRYGLAIVYESRWQFAVCLALITNLISLLIIEFNRSRSLYDGAETVFASRKGCRSLMSPNLVLCGLIAFTIAAYTRSCGTPVSAVTLLFGLLVGKLFAVVGSSLAPKRDTSLALLVAAIYAILLFAAAFASPGSGPSFQYFGRPRWCGVWDNPNIAGVHMAVGTMLAIGIGVCGCKRLPLGSGAHWRRAAWGSAAYLSMFAAAVMGWRLLGSLSRGAWLSFAAGVTCFCVDRWRAYPRRGRDDRAGTDMPSSQETIMIGLRRNRFSIALLVVSCGLSTAWHLRDSEWYLGRRLCSPFNSRDFSWRNRVTAWEGALQIIAEHPLSGTGWNCADVLYEHYYLPPEVSEGSAIHTNDFLMLGATVGDPGMLCLVSYLWRRLRISPQRSHAGGGVFHGVEFYRPVMASLCRAAAIILVASFCFDGGLFRLGTGTMF